MLALPEQLVHTENVRQPLAGQLVEVKGVEVRRPPIALRRGARIMPGDDRAERVPLRVA